MKTALPLSVIFFLISGFALGKSAERPPEIKRLKQVFRIPELAPDFKKYLLGQAGEKPCVVSVEVSEDTNNGMMRSDPIGTFYSGIMMINITVPGDGETEAHPLSDLYYGNRSSVSKTNEFTETKDTITYNSTTEQTVGGSPEGNSGASFFGLGPTKFAHNNEITIHTNNGIAETLKIKSHESGGLLALLNPADNATCSHLQPIARADLAAGSNWQKSFQNQGKDLSLPTLLKDMEYSLKLEERWRIKSSASTQQGPPDDAHSGAK